MTEVADTVAARLREMFDSGEVAGLEPLLHPQVRWGGEDDTVDTCHTRADVLTWYRRAHAAGVRARVTEIVVRNGAVVLALALTGQGPDRSNLIYQVFRLADGLVIDIRGYPQRELALRIADTPLPARG